MSKTIVKEYNISRPAETVWDALVNPEQIDKWGGGPAKMTEKAGEDFSLWGGDITGKNIKVLTNKLLVQEWIAGDWEKPSIVEFELTHKDRSTTLTLRHTNVPDDERVEIDKGWDEYYLGPLKDYLEKK